jgi:hypothetical protein
LEGLLLLMAVSTTGSRLHIVGKLGKAERNNQQLNCHAPDRSPVITHLYRGTIAGVEEPLTPRHALGAETFA